MAFSFSGRIESKLTIPTGGAAISATVANGAGAQTVTFPAASYYLTTAGGVSGLLSTMQTQLNQTHNLMGFPQTAAAAALAIGAGTWTSGTGYLCQEASGSLASSFGLPATLAPTSSPTYRNTGTTTGDYAVGFDSAADDFRGGVGDFNVTGTDDIIIAWVGKFTTTPSGGGEFLFVKGNSGAARWGIYAAGAALTLEVVNSAGTYTSAVNISTVVGEWHVGIACIDRTAGTVRISVRGLTSGLTVTGANTAITANTSSNADAFTVGGRNGSLAATSWRLSALYIVKGSGVATGVPAAIATAVATFAGAVNSTWTVSMDSTGGTGRVSIGWSGYATPTWSLSWTDTTLRDVLGFTANISVVTTTQTGTESSEAVWFPDAPLNIDDEPRMAPLMSDQRTTQSPTGNVIGLVGNTFYKHTNVRWERVPIERYREASATYPNQSLEAFWASTQLGQGSSYFSVCSPLMIYYNQAGTQTAVGSDESISGWTVVGGGAIKDVAKKADTSWTGHWNVTLPAIVSAG
jgi:hypothetical protein